MEIVDMCSAQIYVLNTLVYMPDLEICIVAFADSISMFQKLIAGFFIQNKQMLPNHECPQAKRLIHHMVSIVRKTLKLPTPQHAMYFYNQNDPSLHPVV